MTSMLFHQARERGLHYGDCASFDTYGCCEGRLPCDCTAEGDALSAEVAT